MKSYAGILVAALAVLAACSSNKPTTTNPPVDNNPPTANSTPTTPPADAGMTGAPTARQAAQAFLDAGKAQDLQALSVVWGSSQGPLRNTEDRAKLEKRELIMMCFFRFNSDSIGSPSAAAGGRIVFPVTLTRGNLARTTTITTMVGPASRWYVETIDLPKIEAFCQKQPN
ncbi:MAG TPA: hypothetical protein VK679_05605 [Gemmatimonadaceae bacterium]|nr:hypothetical protein [Gemmatimonadaceae bacterium]